MKNLKTALLKNAKRIKYLVKPQAIPTEFVHKNIPYFSQWESPQLAKDILEKKISTDNDPNWRTSGAKTKKEYHDWSWAGCGMACTKMLLAHRTDEAVPIVELGKKCAEYGGYTMPLEESAGLLYKPYLSFVNKEFGWNARIAIGMPQEQIIYELSKGNFVIASVSPEIRYPEKIPKMKGGHLILMLGYSKNKKEFYFHNPSGISEETQKYAKISFKDFENFYSGRGIIIQGDAF